MKLAAGSIDIHVPTPTIKDAVAQLIKNLSQVGVLTAILLAMGSVAGEKESGTAAFVLVKPVSRFAFLAAKFSGLAITMAAAVLLCGLAAYLYTAVLFAPLSAPGLGADSRNVAAGCQCRSMKPVVRMTARSTSAASK